MDWRMLDAMGSTELNIFRCSLTFVFGRVVFLPNGWDWNYLILNDLKEQCMTTLNDLNWISLDA